MRFKKSFQTCFQTWLASSILALGAATCSGLNGANALAEEKHWNQAFKGGESDLADQRLMDAESQFREAVKLSQSAAPDDQAKCLGKLADVLALRNQPVGAASFYQRELSVLERKYGKANSKVVPPLLSLGSMYESEGNHTAAMVFYRRAMHINEKNYGPYSPAVVEDLHRIGRASYKAGMKEDAAKHYKLALSALLQEPGLNASGQMEGLLKEYSDLIKNDDHSKQDLLADFRKDLASGSKPPTVQAGQTKQTALRPQIDPLSLKTEEQLSQADTLSSTKAETPDLQNGSAFGAQSSFRLNAKKQFQTDEDAIVLKRSFAQPFSSSELTSAYGTMNDVLTNQGHHPQSEDLYQRKIAIDIKALGANHPSVANDLNSLAMLYVSQQRYKEAEPLLLKAKTIYESVYGTDNALVVRNTTTLASVEYYLGNVEKAAQLYRSALGAGLESLGPQNLQTARILNELAYLYFQQGKLQAAQTFYQWALASTEGAVGASDPLYAACMKDYAQVLRALGHSKEADDFDSKAASILAQAPSR